MIRREGGNTNRTTGGVKVRDSSSTAEKQEAAMYSVPRRRPFCRVAVSCFLFCPTPTKGVDTIVQQRKTNRDARFEKTHGLRNLRAYNDDVEKVVRRRLSAANCRWGATCRPARPHPPWRC